MITLLLNRDDRTREDWYKQFEFVLKKILHRKFPNRTNPVLPADRLWQADEIPDQSPNDETGRKQAQLG